MVFMSEEFYLAETKPNNHDNRVDKDIQDSLYIGSGKSFVTFAGAGSGKTYSLKKALDFLIKQYTEDFYRQGKQVAVVTFTNNAADEINDRIEKNPIFAISTIHSFCWSAIAGFNEDIRQWYVEKIPADLNKLVEKEKKGRAGKASDNRKRDIIRLEKKLKWLEQRQIFTYDPNGVNSSQNALSHDDVLDIFSNFLTTKPMMVEIIVNKFPFIFIDESQDANKNVVNAFFALQNNQSDKVVIGLFGDTMQRIFDGGEVELGKTKPNGWVNFAKEMNHRSARRIIGLGNQIRSEDDGRKQYAREGTPEGFVRYFILPHNLANKENVEDKIRRNMAQITGDSGWKDIQSTETAILLLEHKMASRRLGFIELWNKLSKSRKTKRQISKGDNTELNFFANVVYPLADANIKGRRADVMSILRKSQSPLLESDVLDDNKDDPLSLVRHAEHEFGEVIASDKVSFREVLEVLTKQKLLKIPQKLRSFVTKLEKNETEPEDARTAVETELEPNQEEKDDSEIAAWTEALETNFFQIKNYKSYIDEASPFRTHQGVKGNEFERVMVIMDDDEAGGFLFSYDQYFSAKEPSKVSQEKQRAGEEISPDRTRRLFYVTSTRAKNSLVHVIYTSDVVKVRTNLIKKKFAQECEIIKM